MKTHQVVTPNRTEPYLSQKWDNVSCEEFGKKGIDMYGNVLGFDKHNPICLSCTLHTICPYISAMNIKDVRIKEIKSELNIDYFLDESQVNNSLAVNTALERLFYTTNFPILVSDILEKLKDISVKELKSIDPIIPKLLLIKLIKDFNLSPELKITDLTDEYIQGNENLLDINR